jgi:hypothetical protein
MRWSRVTVVWFAIASTLIFCILTIFTKNADMLIVMRGLQVTSSFAVAIRFWTAAKVAWRDDFRSAAQVYAFAMFFLSIALGLNALWLWLWRSVDEPRWMVDSWVNGYFVLLTYLAQSGKLIAPGSKHGRPQPQAYVFLALTLVAGAILGVIGLFDNDYASTIIKAIEPFTRESAMLDPSVLIPKWAD